MSYFNQDQQDAMKHLARETCRRTQENLNAAFVHLMKALPKGWEIRFVARQDEAEMELYDMRYDTDDGQNISSQWDGDSHDIELFLDHAIQNHKAGRLEE